MTRLGIRQGTTIGILVLFSIIALTTCKKETTSPDSPPTITSYQPTAYLLTQKVGDTLNFEAIANDADDDPFEYKTLKDGIQVNDTNTFEFIIDKIGGFRIQIIAYNTESDTAEWYVSVENQQPTISYMGHVRKNEDEIIISEVVKSPTISDLEDDVSELRVELNQTNSELIKLILDSDNQIIVDDYQEGASGLSEVQYRVTDTGGYSVSKGFHYIINPMTDVIGKLWGVSPNLNIANYTIEGATVDINGNTVTTDGEGRYHLQINPTTEDLYLQITDDNHHPRTLYITATADTNMTNHSIENSAEFPELYFNFFNDVFMTARSPPRAYEALMKWDKEVLSIFMKNPPDQAYADMVTSVYANEIVKYSGGTVNAVIIATDSASADIVITWWPWSKGEPYGSTYVWTDQNDPSKIVKAEVTLGDWLQWPEVRKHVVQEEGMHSTYFCKDTDNPNYSQSTYFIGSFFQELQRIDENSGIVASKLPRGYKKNQ